MGRSLKVIGVSSKKFPSSIEPLVRRAGKGGEPVSINPLVDFYNSISLEYLVIVEGFDLDQLDNGLELMQNGIMSSNGEGHILNGVREAVFLSAATLSGVKILPAPSPINKCACCGFNAELAGLPCQRSHVPG